MGIIIIVMFKSAWSLSLNVLFIVYVAVLFENILINKRVPLVIDL